MTKKMQYLSKNEQEVITTFIKELKDKLGDEVITIRLFGSKARGNYKKYSDIDIFILVKEKTSEISDALSEIEIDYDIKYGLPISTVLYSLYEYKKNKELGSFFFENVEKEGVPL
ncbi:MAG: nucleotidyltransferase domain-containing protein [Candidatus Edwardsbacteria bacterium]